MLSIAFANGRTEIISGRYALFLGNHGSDKSVRAFGNIIGSDIKIPFVQSPEDDRLWEASIPDTKSLPGMPDFHVGQKIWVVHGRGNPATMTVTDIKLRGFGPEKELPWLELYYDKATPCPSDIRAKPCARIAGTAPFPKQAWKETPPENIETVLERFKVAYSVHEITGFATKQGRFALLNLGSANSGENHSGEGRNSENKWALLENRKGGWKQIKEGIRSRDMGAIEPFIDLDGDGFPELLISDGGSSAQLLKVFPGETEALLTFTDGR